LKGETRQRDDVVTCAFVVSVP